MRFTGQVKIPDLDYPGVPASVQVDGKQVELFVEGESLGRWSLVDVRAERLVSSAFSLKLAGEEVTFIADQPTEFAYGGVEAMANVWAKHKTMRLPLRMVANSRSRQGTKPSRIPDLRNAIEETLAGTSATALDPTPPPHRREASGIASLRESTGRRVSDAEPSVADEAASPPEDRAAGPRHMAPESESESEPRAEPAEPERAESPAEAGPEDTEVTSEEHDPVPDAPDTPDVVFTEPATEPLAPPPASDSVFKESVPWAIAEPAEAEELPAPEEPVQAESEEPTPVAESPDPKQPDVAAEPEVAEPEGAPEREVPQSGSVPWLAPQLPEDPVDEAKAMAADPDKPTSPEDADEVEPIRDPEYVVDLGAFEDREKVAREEVAREEVGSEDEPAAAIPSMADADDEDAEALPVATSGARGGIMGAVRSAFVRNRVEHTHVYVEAPGGLGIKRQICAECGHISIGVE